MRTLPTVLIIAALAFPAGAQAPLAIGNVKLSADRTIAEIDMNRLKGDPSRMAWSPDETKIYLQTIEGPFHQPKAVRHYLVGTSDGKIQEIKGEPDWFSAFWMAKSNKSSPDSPGFEIALTSENRREQTTSVPRGGDLARGGVDTGSSGSSVGEAVAAANNSQVVTVHTMKLHGQTIGEFINSVIVPGLTFAWAPKGARAIAYAEPKGGRLVLLAPDRRRQELDGTRDALLPMWSGDATRLAWLQKAGKRKFEIRVADVQPK